MANNPDLMSLADIMLLCPIGEPYRNLPPVVGHGFDFEGDACIIVWDGSEDTMEQWYCLYHDGYQLRTGMGWRVSG